MIKYLMHKDDAVAILDCTDFYIKDIQVIKSHLLPFQVTDNPKQFNQDFTEWKKRRCIPQIAQKFNNTKNFAVGLNYIEISNSVQASVTDCYWIKPKSLSRMTWEDVNYYRNKLSDRSRSVMLNDENFKKYYDKNNSIEDYFLKHPFEDKGIKYFALNQYDNYCIVKAENFANNGYDVFNELIGNIICEVLNIPHAEYYIVPHKLNNKTENIEVPLIACELCIQDDNFEIVTMEDLIKTGAVSKYEVYSDLINRGFEDFTNKMITLDFLMLNPKRDFTNFGYIRDSQTLNILGVMPIFDCGASFGCLDNNKRTNEIIEDLSMPFKKRHMEQIQLVTSFEWLDFNELYDCISEIEAVLSYSSLPSDKQKFIVDKFVERIHLLEQYISNAEMDTKANNKHSKYRILENIKHRFDIEKIKENEGFDPLVDFNIDKIFFSYLSEAGKKEFDIYDSFNPNIRERFIKFKKETFGISIDD